MKCDYCFEEIEQGDSITTNIGGRTFNFHKPRYATLSVDCGNEFRKREQQTRTKLQVVQSERKTPNFPGW